MFSFFEVSSQTLILNFLFHKYLIPLTLSRRLKQKVIYTWSYILKLQGCLRMYDLLLPLGIKGIRQSDIFKYKFQQQTKAFRGKIKFSKINLVLPAWKGFFYLQSHVYLIL